MNITKLGHSCFTVEEDDIRVIIDPGEWTKLPKELPQLHAVLLSHIHSDHWSKEHLERIRDEFPDVPIYTNEEVGELLHEAGIDDWQEVEDGDVFDVEGLEIEVHEALHVPITEGAPRALNSTFLVDGRFFFPADAEYEPEIEIEIMTPVVAAPFYNLAQAADYIKRVAPKTIIPAHDGLIQEFARSIYYEFATKAIEEVGGSCKVLKEGASAKV